MGLLPELAVLTQRESFVNHFTSENSGHPEPRGAMKFFTKAS